jgi:ferredoxin
VSGLRIRADRAVCVGAGNCVMTVAEVFDQDDADGLVLVRQETPPPDLDDLVRQAADLCPSGAIEVVDGT